MDIIEQLPLSNGYTAILVVVDRFSKESVLIPTTDSVTAQDIAGTFVSHVFSKHGIPLHVSSDPGSEFTSAPLARSFACASTSLQVITHRQMAR